MRLVSRNIELEAIGPVMISLEMNG